MAGTTSDQVTRALASAAGDRRAAADLLPLLYDELRRLARSWLRRWPEGQTLQTTALVHEAYLRLVGPADPGWEGRAHFFGAAAQAMRQVLVDQARRRSALKRGGDRRCVNDADMDLAIAMPDDELLGLDEALDRLEHEEPRAHHVVILKFFGGLSARQTAELLDVSDRTIDRDWQFARAWLHRDMSGPSLG